MENELKQLVGQNEKIMYEGRPNKKCFIFESIFNPLLPFAIIWALFDVFMIGGAFSSGAGDDGWGIFIIVFMLFHLMPVWIYLGGVLLSYRKYRNTYYIVTDSAVYVSSGMFSKRFDTKPFQEMSRVNLHRGVFDQAFGVGDVIITSNQLTDRGVAASMKIDSISNYTEVYNLIKKLQKDMYTDALYPNDLRPRENHGYNTEYKG